MLIQPAQLAVPLAPQLAMLFLAPHVQRAMLNMEDLVSVSSLLLNYCIITLNVEDLASVCSLLLNYYITILNAEDFAFLGTYYYAIILVH